MPTINAMTRQSAMFYKISPKGLSISALSNRKGLATGVPNAFQANRNDYNYINSFFGGTDSFSSLMSDYSATKKQFTDEYESTMSRLEESASKLMTASRNAGKTMEQAADSTKSAVFSLQNYTDRQTGLEDKERQDVKGALSALAGFGESYGGASEKIKKNAQSAVKTVQGFLEQRTGVTEKEIDEADGALADLKKQAEEPESMAEMASRGGESSSALRSFLNDYAGAGEPVLENAEAAVRFLQELTGKAAQIGSSLNVLQAFARNNSGTDEKTQAALESVREMNPVDEETTKAAGEALNGIQAALEQHRAGTADAGTMGRALSSMDVVDSFLVRYDSAAGRAVAAEDKKELETIQKSVDEAKEVFAPLQTVRDFVDEDSAVRGAAKEENEEILSAAKEFAGAYNNAVQFLQDNRDLSSRAASLADVFRDTKNQDRSLGAIGITSSFDGTLSVNEDRLTKALEEKPETVNRTLGADGLAGRAERNVDLANRQEEQVFPTASSMMGIASFDTSKFMYSSHAIAAQANYNNVGTLFSLYF